MKNMTEKAIENFKNGCNCCQAVFCAYAEEMGMSFAQAYKIAEAMGSGMGGSKNYVCGAVSGALMAASLMNSDGQPGKKSQPETYALSQEILNRFAEKNTSVVCRDLLGLNGKKLRSCPGCVEDAAQILYEVMSEKEQNKEG